MNKSDLKIKLEELNIKNFYTELEPFLKNSIRIKLKPIEESSIKTGESKIGGRPDLPINQNWFTETNLEIVTERKFLFLNKKTKRNITKPLSFLAQINLAEIEQYDYESLLPKNGILYFFYTVDQDAWGFDFKDKNKFKVFYYDGDVSNLKRTEYPENLNEDGKFKNCQVKFESEISLPTCDNEVYNKIEEDEMDLIFEEILNEVKINKLLGHADIIQNEMELECELVTNGIYCGDPTAYDNPKSKSLKPNAKEWQLLFQLDSNEKADMMWGDCGRVYFWIKKDDLKNKKFENCWLILQCF